MLEFLTTQTPLFITVVTILGLMIGSFLNVVILRLPMRLEYDWRCQCRDLLEIEETGKTVEPPSLVWSRSRCPDCGHAISPIQNIPVLSYLFLRGRCAACKSRISIRYPVVEVLTAVLFLAVAMHFGPNWQMVAGLCLTATLIALAGIDIDHQLLPDNITLALLWAGLFASLFNVFTDPVSSIIGALAGYLSLWSIYHVFRLLTGKEGMGYGDFKLLAALGAWLGWQVLPLVILLASLIGAVIGVTMIALKRHESGKPIPFGPFIALAGWVALLWGEQIMEAYLHGSGLGRF